MTTSNKFLLVGFMSFSAILVIMFLFQNTGIASSFTQKYASLTGNADIEANNKNLFENFVNNAVNKFNQNAAKEAVAVETSSVSDVSSVKKVDKKKSMIELIAQKPNDFVLKYVNLPYDYKYGSNSIPLAICALISGGDLLELGMV